MKNFSKAKLVQKLGFRTPDHFKGKTFGPAKTAQKFNPAQFRTQHKG